MKKWRKIHISHCVHDPSGDLERLACVTHRSERWRRGAMMEGAAGGTARWSGFTRQKINYWKDGESCMIVGCNRGAEEITWLPLWMSENPLKAHGCENLGQTEAEKRTIDFSAPAKYSSHDCTQISHSITHFVVERLKRRGFFFFLFPFFFKDWEQKIIYIFFGLC